MSYNPYISRYYNNRYDNITGLGHGSDWGDGHKYDPHTRSYWPPGDFDGTGLSLHGEPSRSRSSNSESTYGGRVMSGGAAAFYPGGNTHYHHSLRGEWEDDDF